MHHFYVRLAEPGDLRVGITWPDPTDEFYLYVYRGRLGENDGAPPDDQRLGHDTSAASLGKRGFLFEDLDPGDYTVRVIYFAVIEGSYQGRVWSPPPAPEIIPPASSGPAERREYPLDPGDPLFNDQWGLEKIGAPEAWQEDRSTGHGITIGIVDSGLDLQHPDFSCPGKLLILPGATIGSGAPPSDSKGHGTHVAGIAGACAGNEEGGAGVAPDATIMPVNANDAILASDVGPGSNDAAMAEGIRFATDNGAHVINLSIGPPPWEGSHFPEMHPETEAALHDAHEAGVVVVAAAGNFSSPVCEFPSLSGSVICVGATDRNDRKTYYSDFPVNLDRERNRAPSVLAPGGEAHLRCLEAGGEQITRGIVSTHLTTREDEDCGHPAGYRELPGTSMASPFVAGVAALVYDRLGGARSEENGDDVIRAITTTAVDLYAPGWDPFSGSGRVDALAAVASVELTEEEEGGQTDPSPAPTASSEPSPAPNESTEPSPEPSPSSTDAGEPAPEPSPSSSDPGEPSPEPSPSSSDPGSPTAHQATVSPRDVKGAVGTESTLTVSVVDAGGEPLSGIPVEWASVGVGELIAVEDSTDAAGRAVATVVSDEPGDQGVMVWTDSCDAEGRCWDTATRHHGPEVCDVFGTRGDDLLQGSAASEVICAFGGDDLVVARSGNDTVIGGSGDDDLRGGAGNDRLKGGRGGDLLIGGQGRDVMAGGAGKDTCWGSSGDRSTSCRS